MIFADRDKIIEILEILVNNAIKFTSSGYVKFGYEIKGYVIEFFVEDSGIGISEKDIPYIFRRFRQADEAATRQYGGTGLGLAIAQNYVRLLDGEIWVKSKKNIGSTFYFTIPYELIKDDYEIYKPNSKVFLEENNEYKSQKKIILVAEDDKTNYYLLSAMLRGLPYSLIHAENGQEAIDIVKTTPDISLILMDIKMPVLDGYEATKNIKSDFPEIPIIAQNGFRT